jgi:glycine/D-amino acid oxidase-like deaminating enzyme
MYDLAVVGSGFWGTAVAYEAMQAGMRVLIVDARDQNGASRNAAGIVCRGWYRQETVLGMTPHDWTQDDFDVGFAWLKKHADLRQTGEEFWSYRSPIHKVRDDCYLIPSPDAVLRLAERATFVLGKATAIIPESPATNWRVLVEVDGVPAYETARQVVVAAGAWTDHLLQASGMQPIGVKSLRGRAAIVMPGADFTMPKTYMVRPYAHFTLRPWKGGLARLGDTVERKPDRELNDTPLMATLQAMSPGSKIMRMLDGNRPVCDRFTVREAAPGFVVATGGHRVGLGVAGTVAQRALKLLGIQELIAL